MINEKIKELQEELIKIAENKKLTTDSVVQASQELDYYILENIKEQIKLKKTY